PSASAAKAAHRLPSAASSSSSRCETAAPEIAGIGGAESSSKHTPRAYPARPVLVPVVVAAAAGARGRGLAGRCDVPREARTAEVVGNAVPGDGLGRAVLGEAVEGLAAEGHLRLAVRAHDRAEAEPGRSGRLALRGQ